MHPNRNFRSHDGAASSGANRVIADSCVVSCVVSCLLFCLLLFEVCGYSVYEFVDPPHSQKYVLAHYQRILVYESILDGLFARVELWFGPITVGTLVSMSSLSSRMSVNLGSRDFMLMKMFIAAILSILSSNCAGMNIPIETSAHINLELWIGPILWFVFVIYSRRLNIMYLDLESILGDVRLMSCLAL